jgi:hypothetical protein
MKLFKQKIVGIEGTETGINQNYRTTFNVADDQITVKVDKITKPDLTRIETIDEEVLPEITFETVAEKTFMPSDFPKTTDHITWYVFFDAETETITVPDQLLNLIVQNGKTTAELWQTYYGSFTPNIVPLFLLQNFDRLAEGFSKSVLVVYYDPENAQPILDTIIQETATGEFQDIDYTALSTWQSQNITPTIQYSIKDEEGNPVAATVAQRTEQQNKNQYRVSLTPGTYLIDITFTKSEYSNLSNRYDIDTVNGIVNKNRIDIASGTVPVQYNLNGLTSGEVAKFKLNVGKFRAFSELWVDIV